MTSCSYILTTRGLLCDTALLRYATWELYYWDLLWVVLGCVSRVFVGHVQNEWKGKEAHNSNIKVFFLVGGCDYFGFFICYFRIANLFSLKYTCLICYYLYIHSCNTLLLASWSLGIFYQWYIIWAKKKIYIIMHFFPNTIRFK